MRTEFTWWKKQKFTILTACLLTSSFISAQNLIEIEAESTTDYSGLQFQESENYSGGLGINDMSLSKSSYARYTIADIPEAGTYNLDIHFANMQRRYAYIKIGNQLPTLVYFNVDSPGWSIPSVKTIQVYLEQGDNTMEIGGFSGIYDGIDNLPNLDKFVISYADIDILKPAEEIILVEREAESADGYTPSGDSNNRHGFSGGKGASTEEMSPLVYSDIIAPEEGLYTLVIDYAVVGERSVTVQVNEQPSQDVVFANTGSWGNNVGDEIGQRTIYIYLNKGSNTLRLYKYGETCPPLDKFIIKTFIPGGIPAEYREGIVKGNLPATISLINDWGEEGLNEIAEALDGTQTSVLFDLAASVEGPDVFVGSNPNTIKYFNGTIITPAEWNNIIIGDKAASIELIDGYDFDNIRPYFTSSISYTRDFSGMDGWASICLPFEYQIDEETIEEFTEFTGTSVRFESARQVLPNTPYIVKVDVGTGIKTFVASTEQLIPVTQMQDIEKGESVFKGNYKYIGGEIIIPSMYLLKPDGSAFAKGSSESSISSFRAYLQTPDSSSGQQLSILRPGEGGETNIHTNENAALSIYVQGKIIVIVADETQKILVYGIDGRLVREMQLEAGENYLTDLEAGIYLINNHKVVLK